jgi:hypothetical protein
LQKQSRNKQKQLNYEVEIQKTSPLRGLEKKRKRYVGKTLNNLNQI